MNVEVKKTIEERKYPWIGTHLGVEGKDAMVVIFIRPGYGVRITGSAENIGNFENYTEREYRSCTVTLSN